MTITQPNKERRIKVLFNYLILGLMVSGLFSVYFYNHVVTFKKSVREKQEIVAKLELENANLKNIRFGLLDANHLSQVAFNLGMIKENNPNYLTIPSGHTALKQ